MQSSHSPSLTFFVELAAGRLARLFAPPGVVSALAGAGAGISMAILDLSAERAEVIRTLNAHGIPVTAWLVLEEDHGYWLTADNAGLARRRYRQVRDWITERGLEVEGVGLDIESPHEDAMALVRHGRRALGRLLRKRRTRAALNRAAGVYADLVAEIRSDGRRVETYQFPVVLDERRAGSTLLQRTLGIVDIAPDREVLMLYRSNVPGPLGDALVDCYGPEAEAIGVGVTGGGVEFLLELLNARLLDLSRLLTDLRRASRYTKHLYVFSLEGCVEGGYLANLCRADLTIEVPPSRLTGVGHLARGSLRTALRAEELWEMVLL
jgi:hypothetical protein